MKHAMLLQVDISKDFHAIPVEISCKVCALERDADLTRGDGPDASVAMVRATGVGAMAGATGLDGTALGLGAGEKTVVGPSTLDMEWAVTAVSSSRFARSSKVESWCEKGPTSTACSREGCCSVKIAYY